MEPAMDGSGVDSSANKLAYNALIWRSGSGSLFVPEAVVVADDKQMSGADLEAAKGLRAHHRRWFQGSAGAYYGGRRPAFLGDLSILLVEWRPVLFLSTIESDGRQCGGGWPWRSRRTKWSRPRRRRD